MIKHYFSFMFLSWYKLQLNRIINAQAISELNDSRFASNLIIYLSLKNWMQVRLSHRILC